MKILSLQNMSILESAFVGMTKISYWILMTIAKKESTHSGSLLLKLSFIWNTYLNDDCVAHNARKDEISKCGQLADNVGISKSGLELEQVNLNFLKGFQHLKTGLVWCNLDYKRWHPFHIQYRLYASYVWFLQKVWWSAWKEEVDLYLNMELVFFVALVVGLNQPHHLIHL